MRVVLEQKWLRRHLPVPDAICRKRTPASSFPAGTPPFPRAKKEEEDARRSSILCQKALQSISCWAQTEARNARLVSYMVCLRAWPHRSLKLALSEKLGARDQASRTLTPHKLACKRPNDKPNFAAGARAEVRRRPSKFHDPLPSPHLAIDLFLRGSKHRGAECNARIFLHTVCLRAWPRRSIKIALKSWVPAGPGIDQAARTCTHPQASLNRPTEGQNDRPGETAAPDPPNVGRKVIGNCWSSNSGPV